MFLEWWCRAQSCTAGTVGCHGLAKKHPHISLLSLRGTPQSRFPVTINTENWGNSVCRSSPRSRRLAARSESVFFRAVQVMSMIVSPRRWNFIWAGDPPLQLCLFWSCRSLFELGNQPSLKFAVSVFDMRTCKIHLTSTRPRSRRCTGSHRYIHWISKVIFRRGVSPRFEKHVQNT
jgi:hypothetical protein